MINSSVTITNKKENLVFLYVSKDPTKGKKIRRITIMLFIGFFLSSFILIISFIYQVKIYNLSFELVWVVFFSIILFLSNTFFITFLFRIAQFYTKIFISSLPIILCIISLALSFISFGCLFLPYLIIYPEVIFQTLNYYFVSFFCHFG